MEDERGADANDGQGLLREAIRRFVAFDSDSRRGPAAATTSDVWHQITVQLAAVIGEQGVEVLLRRALHVTSRAFPWSASKREPGSGSASLGAFIARLEARDLSATAEATQALLTTFTELLASLIGASLCERLLAPVWTSLPRALRSEKRS